MTKPARLTMKTDADAWAYLASRGIDRANLTVETREDGTEVIKVYSPCHRCGGRGYGGWYVDSGKCWECNGRNTKNRHVRYSPIAYAKKERVRDLREQKKGREIDAMSARAKAALRQWVRANRGQPIMQALRCKAEIVKNLRVGLIVRGYLSDAQVALALKVADREAERAAEAKVAAPSGRMVVEGTVVSVKEQTNDFGTRLVMTVKVEAEGGVWLAWGTVPSGLGDVVPGARVRFTGTVEPSDRDPAFAFFKRPAKAEKVAA